MTNGLVKKGIVFTILLLILFILASATGSISVMGVSLGYVFYVLIVLIVLISFWKKFSETEIGKKYSWVGWLLVIAAIAIAIFWAYNFIQNTPDTTAKKTDYFLAKCQILTDEPDLKFFYEGLNGSYFEEQSDAVKAETAVVLDKDRTVFIGGPSGREFRIIFGKHTGPGALQMVSDQNAINSASIILDAGKKKNSYFLEWPFSVPAAAGKRTWVVQLNFGNLKFPGGEKSLGGDIDGIVYTWTLKFKVPPNEKRTFYKYGPATQGDFSFQGDAL